MRSKTHIQFELWASIFMLVTLLSAMIYLKYSQSWFDSFFDSIIKAEIHSYRLVTVVTPEFVDDQKFIKELYSFVSACENKSKQADLKMQVECWIDPRCTSDSLDSFKEKLSTLTTIQYIPLQDILKRMMALGLPSVLKLNPSSELTLNILKIWSLDLPFDINIYLDPSLWRKYGTTSSSIMASSAFGVSSFHYAKNSFFINCIFPPANKDDTRIMLINNQFLIGTNYSQDIAAVTAIIQKRLIRYEPAITALLQRPLVLQEPITETDYREDLNKRIEWFQDNASIPLSDAKWISVLSGSIFLQEMAANLCLAKIYSTIGSDLTLSPEELFTKQYMTYDNLRKLYPDSPEELKKALWNMLIENDLSYISSSPNNPNMALLQSVAIP